MNTVILDYNKTPIIRKTKKQPITMSEDLIHRELMIAAGCEILITQSGWIAQRRDIAIPYLGGK